VYPYNRIKLDLEGSHSVRTHWMYQYYGFGLMMAQCAETCRRIFNFFNTDYQYVVSLTKYIYYIKKTNHYSSPSYCNLTLCCLQLTTVCTAVPARWYHAAPRVHRPNRTHATPVSVFRLQDGLCNILHLAYSKPPAAQQYCDACPTPAAGRRMVTNL